jgi:hypothetical protein
MFALDFGLRVRFSKLIRFVTGLSGKFANDCSLFMFVNQKTPFYSPYIVYFRVLLELVRPRVYWR